MINFFFFFRDTRTNEKVTVIWNTKLQHDEELVNVQEKKQTNKTKPNRENEKYVWVSIVSIATILIEN